MFLPEDIRIFRNLSLLHDTSLSTEQRIDLMQTVSPELLKTHEQFVKTLLGSDYLVTQAPQNKATMPLFKGIQNQSRQVLGFILKMRKSNY